MKTLYYKISKSGEILMSTELNGVWFPGTIKTELEFTQFMGRFYTLQKV